MEKEPKGVREVKIIAASFKRSLTKGDAEEEREAKEIEREYSEISRNPLEVAEFTALYVLLMLSPLIILLINYLNGVNPEAPDVRNNLLRVSFGFSFFGLLMFFAAPEGLRDVIKDMVRKGGEVSDRSKRYLMLVKHSEYQIFSAAFVFILFFSLQYWLTGYMPSREEFWNWVALPFTIAIMYFLWKYFGRYMRPLYRIIDALPLNLQLFCIFLVVLLVLLPNYASWIFEHGIFGEFVMNAVVELFFLSLFMECVGVAIELILFMGVRYGLVGTLSSIPLVVFTYLVSAIVSPFFGLTGGINLWYAPAFIGGGVISLFLGFYREDKKVYEWYAAAICIVSSFLLIANREVQHASILIMVALLVAFTIYDAKKAGRLTLQPI